MNKKILLLMLLVTFFTTGIYSQITRGNWLVGGSGSFSAMTGETNSSVGLQKSTYTNISIAPNIGYFFVDKFAAGLKASVTYSRNVGGEIISGGVPVASGGSSKTTWYDFGPFARYYFMPTDGHFNVFAEGNYRYGTANLYPGNGNRSGYSFNAGPVIYFNNSAAIEFSIGYYSLNQNLNDSYSTKNKSFQVNIGFQIHLEKL